MRNWEDKDFAPDYGVWGANNLALPLIGFVLGVSILANKRGLRSVTMPGLIFLVSAWELEMQVRDRRRDSPGVD